MTEHPTANNKLVMSVRESYDQVAAEYARRIYDELRNKPLDRELLERFASSVTGKKGEVCDIGCGPGHVTRYLFDRGVSIFGLDLSPRMVEIASQLNPDISFVVGNMMGLDLADDRLAGIVSFYAICNTPKEILDRGFREMLRVLQPGGLLLIAFHNGEEAVHNDELWGIRVSLDFYFHNPQEIRKRLEQSGFTIEDLIEREPYSPDVEFQSRRTYIFASKKGAIMDTFKERKRERLAVVGSRSTERQAGD